MMETLNIGRKIYEKRKVGYKKMIGLREASRESGVSVSTLSRVECGSMPDLETFRKLCIWLGESADSLLGLEK